MYNEDFWNSRYNDDSYVYGTEPASFIKEQLDVLLPGNILFPADGEGRNSIYAAAKGFSVTACDWSITAREKALKLAAQRGVAIQYDICDIFNLPYEPESFDAIALSFIHLVEEERVQFHKYITGFIKPGGYLILYGFSKEQVKHNSGGPRNEEALYSLENIISDFIDLDFIHISADSEILAEGRLHSGQAEIIKFVGRKLAE
ncbi:MAG: class I SAM-dependent methyltransferase [Ignavibacteria bacterium]|nr:class I SAM-dependent methyltransferase [Ignavibacteria bacterium]